MKRSLLSLTAIAMTAVFAAGAANAESYSPVKARSNSEKSSLGVTADKNAISASQSFLNNINSARVALAVKNGPLASTHVNEAQKKLSYLRSLSAERRGVSTIQSGRVTYDSGRSYRYYPLETGPITVKSMKKGPFWQQASVAVTDAESVYLTLDLNDDSANEYLSEAKRYIAAKEYEDADDELADLTDAIVSVDNEVALPLVKARDNLALARHFVVAKNYDGARYALRHADSALDDMEDDENYANRRQSIASMREDVADLQDVIANRVWTKSILAWKNGGTI